jgi:hypothetical protein
VSDLTGRRCFDRRRDRRRRGVQRAPGDNVGTGCHPAGRRGQKETIAGGGAPHRDIPRTEWRFDQELKEKWDALAGVTGLSVHDGRLSGKTSTTFPVIHVQRTSGLDNQDIVHAIEIRMRVSAGTELALTNTAKKSPTRTSWSRAVTVSG